MIHTCKCLNVIIRGRDTDRAEKDYVAKLIDSTTDQSRIEVSLFLSKATLIKLDSLDAIKVRHGYLCLKRVIGNWQFNYCAICGEETHAIPVAGANHDPNGLAFVNSYLLNDEDKINKMMSDSKYSPTFGIILPRSGEPYQISSEMNSSPRAVELMIDPTMALSSAALEIEASEKVKQFLYQQRRQMEQRINDFASEENRVFEELCQTAQEEKKDFIKMVEAIKRRHDFNAISQSFDKENNSELTVKNISFSQEKKKESYLFSEEATMFELSADFIRKQSAPIQDISYSKQKMRSADFDGLFDMDDIDIGEANAKLKEANSGSLVEEEEEEAAEEHDVFPLKESNQDEVLPLTQSGINIMTAEASRRTRKMMASSVVQNIPYQSKDHRKMQHPANSLPIKIPHLRSKALTELDKDENKPKPGESIADRIQKLARSVRNETEFLDDRPRRRLNTGDLIKSRPIL